jgi:hypothetical protein
MNAFQFLGVDRHGATIGKVRAAWKRLSLAYHPDKNRDQPDEAHRKMVEINNAYDEACNTLNREAAACEAAAREAAAREGAAREAAAREAAAREAAEREAAANATPKVFPHPHGRPLCCYRSEGPISGPGVGPPPYERTYEGWFSSDKETARYVCDAKQSVLELDKQLDLMKENISNTIKFLFCMERGRRVFAKILNIKKGLYTEFWRIYQLTEACIYDNQPSSKQQQQKTLMDLWELNDRLYGDLNNLNGDLEALQDVPTDFERQVEYQDDQPGALAVWQANKKVWNDIVRRIERFAANFPDDPDAYST